MFLSRHLCPVEYFQQLKYVIRVRYLAETSRHWQHMLIKTNFPTFHASIEESRIANSIYSYNYWVTVKIFLNKIEEWNISKRQIELSKTSEPSNLFFKQK